MRVVVSAPYGDGSLPEVGLWPKVRDRLLTAWLIAGPLIGVFVLHWDAFALILFYWLENVVLGALGLARILLAHGGGSTRAGRAAVALRFAQCYGAFCGLHAIFICLILAPEPPKDTFVPFYGIVAAYGIVTGPAMWPIVLVGLGRLVELLRGYVASGAHATTSAEEAMALPSYASSCSTSRSHWAASWPTCWDRSRRSFSSSSS